MDIYSPIQYIEQFHLLFLDQLGRKLDQKLYALKGGCNLRFYFKSIRYSEDIDLDVQIIHTETLRNKMRGILKSKPFKQILQTRKITIINVTKPKQTETTQRWKLSLGISDSAIPLHTKIEFSRRGVQKDVKFETVDPELIQMYRLSPIMFNHYSANTAFEQKVKALATRSQTQARDIFDIYMLITTQEKNILCNKKLTTFFTQAQEKALALTFQDFKSQVVSFLAPDYQAQYDSELVWNDIVIKVIESLEAKIKCN